MVRTNKNSINSTSQTLHTLISHKKHLIGLMKLNVYITWIKSKILRLMTIPGIRNRIGVCILNPYLTVSTWSPRSRSSNFLKLVSTGREDFLGRSCPRKDVLGRTGPREHFLGRTGPREHFLGRTGPREHFLGRLPDSNPASNSPTILRHSSTKTVREIFVFPQV